MYSQEMKNIMLEDAYAKDIFIDVLPSNHLKDVKVTQYPSAFIVNTDSCDEPGTHWVAFYFESENKAQFFDSYGSPPALLSKNFPMFLKNNCWDNITYNQKCLQGLDSKVCGEYCMHYILQRCRGFSSEHVINCQFTENSVINDHLVVQYMVYKKKGNEYLSVI